MTRRDFLISATALVMAGPRAFALQEPVFDRIVAKAKLSKWEGLPIGELVGKIGMELIDTPYVANTLEVNEVETCVINFTGLDCVTFYEVCLALARALKKGRIRFDTFRAEIIRMRYRGGKIAGYESRLHYTTDWFFDNGRRRTVKLVAAYLPAGQKLTKKIDFMSTHPQSYKHLKADPSMVDKIATIEREISARNMQYLPKAAVAEAERELETGDIVGITTSVEGLDCSHTGICYRDGEKLRLLHASSKAGKVILDGSLSEYVAAGSKNTGIIIGRPIS